MKISLGKSVESITIGQELKSQTAVLFQDVATKADGSFSSYADFLSLPVSKYVPKPALPVTTAKQILLIGLGGSSLGAKAVYTVVKSAESPNLQFIENVDKTYIDALLADSKATAFVVVCKSGKTFETLKNLEYVTSAKFRGGLKGDNTYVVAVEGNGTWEWGKTLGAKLYPMPEVVSGRFQVFGAVTAVPLGLVGVDVTKFSDGAKSSTADPKKSADLAATRFHFYQAGLDSDVYFAFDARLKNLAVWYASITAESLGKAGAGITPLVSVGSRDLHFSGQLYLQGKRDKFTTFLSLSNTDSDNLFILSAVKRAYDDANLPYVHIELDASTADVLLRELGDFMQSKMLETVLLGGLMGVNPYDQPGVELYKKYLQ